MRKFQVIIIFLIALLLVVTPSCGNSTPTISKLSKIRLVGTIGPLSIPLAYMVEHNSLASVADETTLEIWANPTQLQAIITGGQADFISLPTNSAALFYNRGIPLQLLDSSIWNILYLITTDTTITSVTDLNGKSVVVPYQGAVPDAIFRVVLKQNSIDPDSDIEIIYAPDPVQGSQMLLTGEDQYAILSEPSATSVINKGQSSGKSFIRALNMGMEWQKATGKAAPTPVAGTIVIGNIKDRPDVINVFLSEYEKAVKWMLANPMEAGEVGARALAEQGFSAGVLTQSMQNIDWEFVPAQDARPEIEAFFNALAGISPNFIGGKLPDDGFYYRK
jgi:NitT/TauT family transport system substrate-binding protein